MDASGTALDVIRVRRHADAPFLDLGTITLLGTGLPTDVLTNPASITVIEGDSLQWLQGAFDAEG